MKVPDDRSPHAIAYHWASRIMTVSLEMVVPGILGHLVDRWLGSKVIFTLIGFSVGLTAGMVHLLRMTRETPGDQAHSESATQERSER
jgi:F0F1-type ATP synthase assembly protein I